MGPLSPPNCMTNQSTKRALPYITNLIGKAAISCLFTIIRNMLLMGSFFSIRLVLQRNSHRNNSCGRLCDRDYEDLGLLMEQKNKFGSTPLFNIPPAPPISNASATTRPTNGKFAGPTSYSCHEVKNGYAIPNGMPNNNCSTFNTENFYAATDIVLKVIIN